MQTNKDKNLYIYIDITTFCFPSTPVGVNPLVWYLKRSYHSFLYPLGWVL